MNINLDLCEGISPERPKMYILSYRLALFSEQVTKNRLNLHGGISPARPEINILRYELRLFSESEVKISHFRSMSWYSTRSERPNMYILSYKLALFSGYGVKIWHYLRGSLSPASQIKQIIVNLEWKLCYILVGAFN